MFIGDMCVTKFHIVKVDVILNGGITIVLETFMSEGLTYEEGPHYIVYVAFTYW